MKQVELCQRKYNKESYTFVLNKYRQNEMGFLGVPGRDHISVITPENALGYPDYILLDHNKRDDTYMAYTLHRYLPPWILKKIETKMLELTKKYCS